MALSLGACVAIQAFEGDFAIAEGGAHLWARHLAEIRKPEEDFVTVAERYLNAPYLWGGRTSEGIDCSGLVQSALTASGVSAPRDSDMMERTLGEPVSDHGALVRGDLIFWKGHIGVMRDAETLLHASGWHMTVVSEPLAFACARILSVGGGAITSVRRFAP